MRTDKAVVDETLTSEKILDVARDQVRRFSESKTNVVDERQGLIHDYAARMTRLVAMILADGVRKKEYKIDDIDADA